MATQKVVVAGSDVTASQMKDFWRQVADGSVTRERFQAFLDHQDVSDGNQLSDINWQKVYEALGMSAEWERFSQTFTGNKNSNLWSIPVLKGVTPNKVVKALRKLGVTVDLYCEDLDRAVPTNDRDPNNGSYAISFRKTIEADPELASKSADDLKKEGTKGITLLERLLLELGYFLATGRHLDIENWTLCSGSRGSVGRVPYVLWDASLGRLDVFWHSADSRYSDLRSRSAVS